MSQCTCVRLNLQFRRKITPRLSELFTCSLLFRAIIRSSSVRVWSIERSVRIFISCSWSSFMTFTIRLVTLGLKLILSKLSTHKNRYMRKQVRVNGRIRIFLQFPGFERRRKRSLMTTVSASCEWLLIL